MKNAIYNLRYYLLWLVVGAIGYSLAYKIGKDARSVEKKHELVRSIAGARPVQKLRQLRHSVVEGTIEENIRFSVRLGEDVRDRIERRGILVRRPYARAVILICHGFTCGKDDVRFLRGSLFSQYTTLSFDFRAHGECCTSEHICTFGSLEKYDVIGAVEFIRSQPDLEGKPIIVYGFSMGAVSAILAQAERPDLFHAAILDCPFESTDKLIERLLSKLHFSIAGYQFDIPGKGLLQRYAYNPYVQEIIKKALRIRTSSIDNSAEINVCMVPVDTVLAARSCHIPAFLIVCKKDNKAPVSAAYDIYRALPHAKRLWITNGREHFDSFFFNPEKYGYKVLHFIEEVLDGSIKKNPVSIDIDDPDQDYWKKQLALYQKEPA